MDELTADLTKLMIKHKIDHAALIVPAGERKFEVMLCRMSHEQLIFLCDLIIKTVVAKRGVLN